MMRILVLVVLVAGLAAACSSGGEPAALPPTLAAAAAQAGVTHVDPITDNTELYTSAAATVTIFMGTEQRAELVTFASKSAQESWVQAAVAAGSVILNQGNGWVVAR